MKNKVLKSILFTSILFSQYTISQETDSLEFELAKNAYDSLTSKNDVVKMSDFSDRINGTLTSVGTKKDPGKSIYIAEIGIKKSGAEMLFRIYSDCTPTDGVIYKIITVNRQNIQVGKLCDNNKEFYQTIYMPSTDAGADYLYREFSKKEYVTVDFGNIVIPFSTNGFQNLWNRKNQPAL